jgi:hypothetical protein
MKNFKKNQFGASFIGILFFGGVLVFLGIVGAQVLPTFTEYQTINKAVDKAKTGVSVAEVRSIFDKAGQIDDIKSITGKDLVVTKEGDKTVVSFTYNKEIHLAGPAYLLIKYAGRSK